MAYPLATSSFDDDATGGKTAFWSVEQDLRAARAEMTGLRR